MDKICTKKFAFTVSAILIGFFVFLIVVIATGSHMNVWVQSLCGQAELAKAEYNRKIAILEALAKKESAKALSEAEIIRAQGAAEANKIIGDSLTDNEGYLRYLWIQGIQTGEMQVIYVPTEASLPILESQRLNMFK